MIDYQNKKFKENTPENLKEFIAKKLNDDMGIESKKSIIFDVEGKPPKKSNWGKDDAHLIVKLREEALKAREKLEIRGCFQGKVKLNLIVHAPNIDNMEYKQTGDDDPKKFIGDLDSLVAGVCEYLQPAPTNPDLEIHSVFEGKDEIGPSIPIIIQNDAQIVEITAKKEIDDTLHYHVEVTAL